jgi:hypothetical protein
LAKYLQFNKENTIINQYTLTMEAPSQNESIKIIFIIINSIIGLLALCISIKTRRDVRKKEKHLKKLHEDKSVLYPLLIEKYDYLIQNTEQFDPDGIVPILKILATQKLHNLSIKQKIDDINREDEPVFLHDGGRDYALSTKIEELFKDIRHYLAEVIP